MQIPSISMFCISPSDHGCWSAGIVAVLALLQSSCTLCQLVPFYLRYRYLSMWSVELLIWVVLAMNNIIIKQMAYSRKEKLEVGWVPVLYFSMISSECNTQRFCIWIVVIVSAVTSCYPGWGSINTGWHINARHVKHLHTHTKCKVKHNGV